MAASGIAIMRNKTQQAIKREPHIGTRRIASQSITMTV